MNSKSVCRYTLLTSLESETGEIQVRIEAFIAQVAHPIPAKTKYVDYRQARKESVIDGKVRRTSQNVQTNIQTY